MISTRKLHRLSDVPSLIVVQHWRKGKKVTPYYAEGCDKAMGKAIKLMIKETKKLIAERARLRKINAE